MKETKLVRRRVRGGFTLLEVLIVIGILALLAAFVVPNFMGAQQRANIDMTKAKIGPSGVVANALELYRVHMGSYPDSLAGLTEEPSDADGRWGGPYIQNPGDLKDAWGEELQYRYPGEVRENSYDLWSKGPDRQDGTDDDIKNWDEG